MYIPNDDTQVTNCVDYMCRLWLKRLNTELDQPTNQNSIKVPKLLGQRIRKRYHKTLGTSVMSPTYPECTLYSVRYIYMYT